MSAAGIWNHHAAASISLAAAKPAANTTAAASTATSGTSGGATISANDFLSLLVTEMQNQDPTASTDPNEYINQLVNVNSLEQLIQINQTLSSATGGNSAPGVSSPVGAAAGPVSGSEPAIGGQKIVGAPAGPVSGAEPAIGGPKIVGVADTSSAPAPATVPGNLGVPGSNPAAERVSRALNGLRLPSGPRY